MPLPPSGSARRLGLSAAVVCVLALAAAVVSFVQRQLRSGIVWVLLAGRHQQHGLVLPRARPGTRAGRLSAGSAAGDGPACFQNRKRS